MMPFLIPLLQPPPPQKKIVHYFAGWWIHFKCFSLIVTFYVATPWMLIFVPANSGVTMSHHHWLCSPANCCQEIEQDLTDMHLVIFFLCEYLWDSLGTNVANTISNILKPTFNFEHIFLTVMCRWTDQGTLHFKDWPDIAETHLPTASAHIYCLVSINIQ